MVPVLVRNATLDIGTITGLRVHRILLGSDLQEETDPDSTLVNSFGLIKFINMNDKFNYLYYNLSINTKEKSRGISNLDVNPTIHGRFSDPNFRVT